jgi:hypothetical protein
MISFAVVDNSWTARHAKSSIFAGWPNAQLTSKGFVVEFTWPSSVAPVAKPR